MFRERSQMIIDTTGSIFDSTSQALVNPVNCEGVSGAGLAKEFRSRYPRANYSYQSACKLGGLKPGRITYGIERIRTPEFDKPLDELETNSDPIFWQPSTRQVHIVYFPTKIKWREPSKIEYIAIGLPALIEFIKLENIQSIAIPALGCGLGGLDWADVRPMIVTAFEKLPEMRVELYGPKARRI